MQHSINAAFNNLFSLVILTLVLAYPVFAYIGLNTFTPAQFAWAILLTFAIRFALIKEARRARQWPILMGVIIFCVLVITQNSEQLLRYYPTLMNAGFGLLFLNSLRGKQSLIEQFLRASRKCPPEHALTYLRGLSSAWGIFLLTNALVSGYTACCATPYTWALYNGFLSYLAIAAFVVAELCYRPFYRRRRGIDNE